MVSTDIGVWVAAALTFFIYSYFAKSEQNIFFRFAQSTGVGIALGYIIAIVMIKNVDYLAVSKIMQGNVLYIIPLLIGLMMYLKFIPSYRYLSRIPIAIIVSVGLGIGARASLDSDVYIQILATESRFVLGVPIAQAMDNLIFIIAVISTICYFFFTLKPEKNVSLNYLSKAGRFFLMAYFGTKFGATILSRSTLLIGRLQFLIIDWLGF